MSNPMRHSGHDEWNRRLLPLVTVVPYVLLAILTGVTVTIRRSDGDPFVIDLALCGLTAAWMLWMFTLHPAWRERPRAMGLFIGVLIVLMAILVIRDPWFGLFTPAGYFYSYRFLSWPSELAAVSGVAIVAGTAQASPIPKASAFGVLAYLAILVVNIVPMCGLAWLGRKGEEHDELREQALAEVNEANRRLEASLAENAGLHEQLLTQAREAGVSDERQRMAREIHDTLAQGLTGVVTQLQAAEQFGDDPALWRRHVRAATGLARESLSEARRSVHALRPEPLETARLSEALAAVAERWSALHGIVVQATTTGTVRPMPPEADVALLRTAQEALANVARHARATKVGLTLSYMENEVALDVRDDGRGFEPDRFGDGGDPPEMGDDGPRRTDAHVPGGGFGLVAMRQRIESLSGTLQVESEPGAGTAISACIPAAPAGAGA
ncbi:signal transduction histidine kinase [Actinoallomurus bryophytorum]|uniref:Oxygen sensor histidine kinase NreB n=1 Tax=Actinoallomurus bryophytorum TaxID=1490222 RepID=A0A543CHB8_9ACTN|nr:sensor histidine kinase [Actinoallomurus bryophytorum]TQL96499.1 signal transduction histidine kinase [Actinoallomurus bryophytorum]